MFFAFSTHLYYISLLLWCKQELERIEIFRSSFLRCCLYNPVNLNHCCALYYCEIWRLQLFEFDVGIRIFASDDDDGGDDAALSCSILTHNEKCKVRACLGAFFCCLRRNGNGSSALVYILTWPPVRSSSCTKTVHYFFFFIDRDFVVQSFLVEEVGSNGYTPLSLCRTV